MTYKQSIYSIATAIIIVLGVLDCFLHKHETEITETGPCVNNQREYFYSETGGFTLHFYDSCNAYHVGDILPDKK